MIEFLVYLVAAKLLLKLALTLTFVGILILLAITLACQ